MNWQLIAFIFIGLSTWFFIALFIKTYELKDQSKFSEQKLNAFLSSRDELISSLKLILNKKSNEIELLRRKVFAMDNLMKDKNGWIKLHDDMKITELRDLGYFLGRYIITEKDYLGNTMNGTYYYVSHFSFTEMELHIRQYPPPVKECVKVNQQYFKLTHYKEIDPPE